LRQKQLQDIGYARALGYALIGGSVAIVFQIPELPTFIPIQSFVLGVTWPLLVAQYTSKSESTREKDKLIEELEKI